MLLAIEVVLPFSLGAAMILSVNRTKGVVPRLTSDKQDKYLFTLIPMRAYTHSPAVLSPDSHMQHYE